MFSKKELYFLSLLDGPRGAIETRIQYTVLVYLRDRLGGFSKEERKQKMYPYYRNSVTEKVWNFITTGGALGLNNGSPTGFTVCPSLRQNCCLLWEKRVYWFAVFCSVAVRNFRMSHWASGYSSILRHFWNHRYPTRQCFSPWQQWGLQFSVPQYQSRDSRTPGHSVLDIVVYTLLWAGQI